MSGGFIQETTLVFLARCFQGMAAFYQRCAAVLHDAAQKSHQFFSEGFRRPRKKSQTRSFGTRVNFFSNESLNQYQYANKPFFSGLGHR